MCENTINDIVDFENLEQVDIPESEVPAVISEQYKNILEIDAKIQFANEKCAEAKSIAEAQTRVKGLNKAEAINSTQDAVRSIADAQTVLADAQKALLVNQQKMADGMRFLLMLGASSIAMNRMVIEQLEAKLKRAESEQLSQSAKDELIGVVRLLREQESTFQKQERMSAQIAENKKAVKAHTQDIAEIRKIDEVQDKKDIEHDSKIAEINKIDEQQNKKDFEHDSKIAEINKVDEEQTRKDAEHDESLKKLKILAWLGIGLACGAIVLAVVAIVI